MKRTVYFFAIVLLSVLASCSGQYDNIDKYASEETIYVGKFTEQPSVTIGHNRVEIDLLSYLPAEFWEIEGIRDLINNTPGLSAVYRPSADEFYLGKIKKTIVEYYENDTLRTVTFDSACSWVNIENLKIPQMYIFYIYAEDEFGNRSVPVEALGRPFTDEDLAGYAFPLPYTIPAPSTMDFRFGDSISSGLYKFVEMTYSYVNRYGDTITGSMNSSQHPASFSVANLRAGEIVPINVTCRIIPRLDNSLIKDTVTLIRSFEAKTATPADYLEARDLRPVRAALLNENDFTEGTITWDGFSDHLVWTEVKFKKLDDTWDSIHVSNSQIETVCSGIKRGELFQIRCAFTPPGTPDVFVTQWKNYATPFLLMYKMKEWTAVSRSNWHSWGADNADVNQTWGPGGHPMYLIDGDMRSGWHTALSGPFPQYFVIDMKATKTVSKVILKNGPEENGYWNHIELYLTDELSIRDYSTHTVNWEWDASTRRTAFANWRDNFIGFFPSSPPDSWGAPVAQAQFKSRGNQSFILPEIKQGRYLIVLFPDSDNDTWTYICARDLEVFGD